MTAPDKTPVTDEMVEAARAAYYARLPPVTTGADRMRAALTAALSVAHAKEEPIEMVSMQQVPPDSALMVAWEKYKLAHDYANSRKWALHEAHVDGSMWAAFEQGWNAALSVAPRPATEAERALVEAALNWQENMRPLINAIKAVRAERVEEEK